MTGDKFDCLVKQPTAQDQETIQHHAQTSSSPIHVINVQH